MEINFIKIFIKKDIIVIVSIHIDIVKEIMFGKATKSNQKCIVSANSAR